MPVWSARQIKTFDLHQFLTISKIKIPAQDMTISSPPGCYQESLTCDLPLVKSLIHCIRNYQLQSNNRFFFDALQHLPALIGASSELTGDKLLLPSPCSQVFDWIALIQMDSYEFLINNQNSSVPVEIEEEHISDLAFLVDDPQAFLQDTSVLSNICTILTSSCSHSNIDVAISSTKTILYIIENCIDGSDLLCKTLIESKIFSSLLFHLNRLHPEQIEQDFFGVEITLDLVLMIVESNPTVILENEELIQFLLNSILTNSSHENSLLLYTESLSSILECCLLANLKIQFTISFESILKFTFDQLKQDKNILRNSFDCLCYLVALSKDCFVQLAKNQFISKECISILQHSDSFERGLIIRLIEFGLRFNLSEECIEYCCELIDFGLLKYIFTIFKLAKSGGELESAIIRLFDSLLTSLSSTDTCQEYSERVCNKFYENEKINLKKLIDTIDANPAIEPIVNSLLQNISNCLNKN